MTAVNDLILQLSRHAERQEAFAADAAHELKTPLALLALELDKLPEHDTRRLQEYLTALSDMIDQLLLLARSNVTEIAKSVYINLKKAELEQKVAPVGFGYENKMN